MELSLLDIQWIDWGISQERNLTRDEHGAWKRYCKSRNAIEKFYTKDEEKFNSIKNDYDKERWASNMSVDLWWAAVMLQGVQNSNKMNEGNLKKMIDKYKVY